MISYLEGTVVSSGPRTVTLAVNGVGYTLTMPSKMVSIIAKDKTKIKVLVHSRLNMREGVFELYGFLNQADLELFGLLTSVSGIGPKNALAIMDAVEAHHLKAAIMSEDDKYLRTVSGLGPKTARRLILELQSKIDYLDTGTGGVDLGVEASAMEALQALGYSPSDAKDALRLTDSSATLQERVREALKILSR